MTQYPTLFSPLRVGPVTLRNRIALAPISPHQWAGHSGITDEHIAFIEEVARGGAGLVTLGETLVGCANGVTHDSIVRLTDPTVRRSLFKVADAAHRHGARISVEISHGGALAQPELNGGEKPWAPSEYDAPAGVSRGDGHNVQPMDAAMMEDIAERFAASCAALKEAGFDMAMVHMGHGWLLHQFLSPLFNKRTDEFGGSLENRARFPLMVLDRIRARVGNDFALEIRISGTDVLDGGLTPEDVGRLCRMMEDRVDLFSVSCGGVFHNEAAERMVPIEFQPRGLNVYLAQYVKRCVSKPVSTVGGLAEPEMLEDILRSGKADLCYMARQLIADPELPKKAAAGRSDDIRRCLRCNCCQNSLDRKPQKLLSCAVNPRVGHESDPQYTPGVPAAARKLLLVAGAGPAGLTAALTAARRGHRVILFEQASRPGGVPATLTDVPFKGDMRVWLERLIRQAEREENIELRLSQALTPELAAALSPDAVIAAIGSRVRRPQIAGAQLPHVMDAKRFYEEKPALTGRVAVVGGGLVGAETALLLHEGGLAVSLIASHADIAEDCARAHHEGLVKRLRGAQVVTGARCTEIRPDELDFRTADGPRTLRADFVILATGLENRAREGWDLCAPALSGRVAGDADKVGTIQTAVRDGYFAAMDI